MRRAHVVCISLEGGAFVLDLLGTQVTAQAFAVTAKAGPSDVASLMKEGAAGDVGSVFGSLQSLPNVLGSVLFPPTEVVPKLPSSSVGVNKAAVISFQTWYLRTPGLVGMLFGHVKGVKSNFETLLVADSLEELLASDKVSRLRQERGVHPVGVIMAGHSCEEDKFEQAAAWCQICLDQGAKAAMCVLAEWQQGVVYIYIICILANFVIQGA